MQRSIKQSGKLIIPLKQSEEAVEGLNQEHMNKIKEYGVVRYSLMSLGLQHKLENDKVVIERYWEPLCELLDIDNDNFGNGDLDKNRTEADADR